MSRYGSRNRLASLAEEQWGLITRRQAHDAGVSPTTLDRLTADNGILRRVGYGVYQLVGTPEPDHLELRVAWLQLTPAVVAWQRGAADGVASHRSAADMYGLGNLAADHHDFTIGGRRQSRRKDVRLHTRRLADSEWIVLGGIPVTRPARIASDLLYEHEDPEAVANLVADALRGVYDYPGTFADALAPHAHRFRLRRGDGVALLRWFLDLVGDPETTFWTSEAEPHYERTVGIERPQPFPQPGGSAP